MLTIDTDEVVIGFPSMFELMWDLKGKTWDVSQMTLERDEIHFFRQSSLLKCGIWVILKIEQIVVKKKYFSLRSDVASCFLMQI